MRTVRELLDLNGVVYVYTPDKSVARLFLKNAEAEGFVFSGNRRPSKAKTSSLFSLKRNFEISYVGSFGYMAFRHPEYENMVTFIRDFDDGKSECKLVRVDYAAYLRGADDYIITQISV